MELLAPSLMKAIGFSLAKKVRSDTMKNEYSKKESRHFYAAMYLRLSREDSDVGTTADTGSAGSAEATFRAESNSIGSQRELIRSFIREQEDIELFDCYADDNYSGSNFERPEFKRMISDIRAGRVNCVIVKDDCVIKARTPQTLENRHFLRIGTEFRAIQRPQRAAYHIETS